ncbi:hypothetical protein KIN20_034518 [Parelaphostrongylus tenuis]|uniref:Uncharacterized protein n=1 Tax=Parelaphostrongylus tenuis TaxID=148309 RepID=A0AAD5RAA4_PARTN|nr:hypothetical protein KIN20_034518 [Parelaphostrongylus tenuis]
METVRSNDMNGEDQKQLILSALCSPPERKSSRVSMRKTSTGVFEYTDVVVEPFPALPIDVHLPNLRSTSVEDGTQSTTNIQEQYPPEDRLKQWAKLEVLPDTEATAALAQLALQQPEPVDVNSTKKAFVPIKHDLKRSTSLEWSEKLFQVPTKPKLRFTSYVDCQVLTVAVQDIVKVKEDLKTVSATLERKGICKQFADKTDKPNDMECKLPQRNASAEELTRPLTSAAHRVVCERKLTPIPRDLVSPHPPKTVRYALFEPVNWLYDSCITEEEFDEKWAAILDAYYRFQQIPVKVPVLSPTATSGRRHSFDKTLVFAKRTLNRTTNYFLQKLRDRVRDLFFDLFGMYSVTGFR